MNIKNRTGLNKILSKCCIATAFSLLFASSTLADEKAHCDSIAPDQEALKAAKKWMDDKHTFIDSMLVQHCGKRIFEDYRRGYDSIMPHDIQSSTKTYTMLLIGVLIEQGKIESVDVPLRDLLPEYASMLEGDKAKITLHHVLTMTTGLQWRDFGKGNSFEKIIAAKDSVKYILSEPLITPPGETFFYNTGSSHLLSAIVTAITGKSAFDFGKEVLFEPLEMMDYEWDSFPDGLSLGGWGLYTRPRDMMKIGQLILDDGRWNGKQLINARFLEAATTQQIDTKGGIGGRGYGYQMWIPNGFNKTDLAAALGYGGQSIFVFDDLDLVVVFTASVEKPLENAKAQAYILSEFVVPEVAD